MSRVFCCLKLFVSTDAYETSVHQTILVSSELLTLIVLFGLPLWVAFVDFVLCHVENVH